MLILGASKRSGIGVLQHVYAGSIKKYPNLNPNFHVPDNNSPVEKVEEIAQKKSLPNKNAHDNNVLRNSVPKIIVAASPDDHVVRSYLLPPIGVSTVLDNHVPRHGVPISTVADPREATMYDHFGENMPILWSEGHNGATRKSKAGRVGRYRNKYRQSYSRKDGGDYDEDLDDSMKNMPNTVSPNPNIYGGFPENDIWGNFELPTPETIDKLKSALGSHIITGKYFVIHKYVHD